MNRVIFIYAVVICCYMICGISSAYGEYIEKQSEKFVPLGDSYKLSEADLLSFREKAEQGDVNAAYRLYLYYAIASYDKELYRHYLTIAAQNGHSDAQVNLAHFLAQEKKWEIACYWLNQAKQNGNERADKALENINQEKKDAYRLNKLFFFVFSFFPGLSMSSIYCY